MASSLGLLIFAVTCGFTVANIPSYWKKPCGTAEIDPRTSLCCEGLPYVRSGVQPACCGAIGYDARHYLCCERSIVRKSLLVLQPACCGQNVIDRSHETCTIEGYVERKTDFGSECCLTDQGWKCCRKSEQCCASNRGIVRRLTVPGFKPACCGFDSTVLTAECCAEYSEKTGAVPLCCEPDNVRPICCTKDDGSWQCCAATYGYCCGIDKYKYRNRPTVAPVISLDADRRPRPGSIPEYVRPTRPPFANYPGRDHGNVGGDPGYSNQRPPRHEVSPGHSGRGNPNGGGVLSDADRRPRPGSEIALTTPRSPSSGNCCQSRRPRSTCCPSVNQAHPACCSSRSRPACCNSQRVSPSCCGRSENTSPAQSQRRPSCCVSGTRPPCCNAPRVPSTCCARVDNSTQPPVHSGRPGAGHVNGQPGYDRGNYPELIEPNRGGGGGGGGNVVRDRPTTLSPRDVPPLLPRESYSCCRALSITQCCTDGIQQYGKIFECCSRDFPNTRPEQGSGGQGTGALNQGSGQDYAFASPPPRYEQEQSRDRQPGFGYPHGDTDWGVLRTEEPDSNVVYPTYNPVPQPVPLPEFIPDNRPGFEYPRPDDNQNPPFYNLPPYDLDDEYYQYKYYDVYDVTGSPNLLNPGRIQYSEQNEPYFYPEETRNEGLTAKDNGLYDRNNGSRTDQSRAVIAGNENIAGDVARHTSRGSGAPTHGHGRGDTIEGSHIQPGRGGSDHWQRPRGSLSQGNTPDRVLSGGGRRGNHTGAHAQRDNRLYPLHPETRSPETTTIPRTTITAAAATTTRPHLEVDVEFEDSKEGHDYSYQTFDWDTINLPNPEDQIPHEDHGNPLGTGYGRPNTDDLAPVYREPSYVYLPPELDDHYEFTPETCNDEEYDMSVYICCDGVLRYRIGRIPTCCGTEAFDAAEYRCCDGNIQRSCDPSYIPVKTAWGKFIKK